MPQSPHNVSDGPAIVTVKSNGVAVQNVDLIAVTVTQALNRIPAAQIVLADGDMPKQDFPLSESGKFKPGVEITVEAGYSNKTKKIFCGVVVRHSIKITPGAGSRLVIECRDKAFAMTLDRKNAHFIKISDNDIIRGLIRSHSGLSAKVSATQVKYGELVQHYCSDWDYMLARAEINGYVVAVDDAKVSVGKPSVAGSAALEVTYGEDLIELDANIDGRTQLESVDAVAWDPATQATVEGSAKAKKLNAQGNLSSAVLAKAVGAKTFRLQSPTPLDKSALDDWAEARQVKAGLARIRGTMKFQGSANAQIDTLIDLKGVGKRFNGSVYVGAVVHRIAEGNWLTEVEFGLAPEWFVETHDVEAPAAAARTPAISGLHIGVVKKLDEDPDAQHRIQVSVPELQAETEGVWARLTKFYGSDGIGAFFIPEIDDEVVLGFMNGDPSHPVVLGSLYSSKRKPPYTLTADNFIKALVTRSKLKVEFDDEKKIVTVSTPESNTIVLSDDKKSITLKDQNGNEVELSPDGIKLDSPKDIKVSAKGAISIDAVGAINVTSKQDIGVKGLNINQEAQVSFTGKGSASAELSAAGQTTVKGSMVMIN